MGHFIYIFIINYRIYSYNNKVQVFLSRVRTTVTFEDSELQEVSVIRLKNRYLDISILY